jgi:NADH dehydrogenase
MLRTRALLRATPAIPAVEEKIVVLGSGWGGFQIALNTPNKNITVVSPNNHFLFTPLLPSTAVGTLEFRCVQEPIRSVLGPNGKFLHAKARSLDPENKKLKIESVHNDIFEIDYDKLVIAVGVKTNTFGIPSIQEGNGIFFLKTLRHARGIRNNIIDSFEKAAVPTVCEAEKKRLLSFVVVGGGPTSCEFCSELHDFMKNDIVRLYPDLMKYIKVTLVEAGPALLGPFDAALQDYAHGLFKQRDIDVRLGTAVTAVEDEVMDDYHFTSRRAMLSDGTSIEFGTMVWSAGLAPRNFTSTLIEDGKLEVHDRLNRVLTDEYLRVKGYEGSIWAIGDAAVNESGVPLPQLAQVARQQGIYMSKVLNGQQKEDEKPFKFFSLGSMAYIGEMKGIYDGTTVGEPGKEIKQPKIRGLLALLMWRFAYWGRQTSMANKILIPMVSASQRKCDVIINRRLF